ncbi:Hypothetical predicted protein [Octopus vulgaris]|uniref:Cytosolic carboxypeptidase 6-like n=1 Tax=Octopus vulgaris TaxID=6645 RepID=A0AA36F9K6_OCTVU|nr:Hypothetical predicted protein [Octopus vulgaris]
MHHKKLLFALSFCELTSVNLIANTGIKQRFLFRETRIEQYDVEFYIDIHAHSTLMNGFMYGNTFEDVDRLEKQAVFPKLLRMNAEDFSMSNTNFNRDAVKAGTGRSHSVDICKYRTYFQKLDRALLGC